MPQKFKDLEAQVFEDLPMLPGCSWSVLAEPCRKVLFIGSE
jgi:hypothetical protein